MCIGHARSGVTLIVTYCPNKAGRQKKETPFPWGTLRPLPHKGFVIPLSMDAGPAWQKQIRKVSSILNSFFSFAFSALHYFYFLVATIPLMLVKRYGVTARKSKGGLDFAKIHFFIHFSKVNRKNLKNKSHIFHSELDLLDSQLG